MRKNQLIIFGIILTIMIPFMNGQDVDIISKKRISSSMAGEGDPWEVLSDDLEKVLLAFHKGFSVSEIAAAFGISERQLIEQLEPLVKANILNKTDKGYFPEILLASEREALNIYNRAEKTARKISETILSSWNKIAKSYNKLNISRTQSLNEIGFMLVGSRILDVGVLRALAKNEELLLPAPLRPTPSYPYSRYYLWIVENSPDKYGYGQKDMELKYDNWYIVNFGRDNESRTRLEEKAVELIESGKYDSPEHFATLIGASYLNKNDSKVWENFVAEISEICLTQLLKEKEEIKELYQTIKTSQYSENAFDDFYCWYYHYVYPIAINNLIIENLFEMPEDHHISIVLYNEQGNGVHFE